MESVTVQLRIVSERVNVHVVLLNDFGKVRLVQNEETWTENRSLYHRANSVNRSRLGMTINDAERLCFADMSETFSIRHHECRIVAQDGALPIDDPQCQKPPLSQ